MAALKVHRLTEGVDVAQTLSRWPMHQIFIPAIMFIIGHEVSVHICSTHINLNHTAGYLGYLYLCGPLRPAKISLLPPLEWRASFPTP